MFEYGTTGCGRSITASSGVDKYALLKLIKLSNLNQFLVAKTGIDAGKGVPQSAGISTSSAVVSPNKSSPSIGPGSPAGASKQPPQIRSELEIIDTVDVITNLIKQNILF